jgi:hypothetical protein
MLIINIFIIAFRIKNINYFELYRLINLIMINLKKYKDCTWC